MTLAFALFSSLCEVANAFAAMREQYPGGSTPHEVLTAVVESLDAWIDFLVETDGIEEVDEEDQSRPWKC